MHFVELRSFDDYISANIIRSRLESEGFYCFLADANTSTILPIISNAIGGIKLMVPENQAQKAREALRRFDAGSAEELKCPRCGSTDVRFISRSSVNNWISAIFFWLMGNYAISIEKVYHCYQCGFEFQDPPAAADAA